MIRLVAPAKINLALHVRACRADGYHEIETVFAFLRDGDELEIAPADSDDFAVTGPFAAALGDEKSNLVTRARDAFRTVFGSEQQAAIKLNKKLPVASGIGGGSADAAATLRGMAQLAGIDRNDPRVVAIAEELGSDVPACLDGRPSLGRGRGETLIPTKLPSGFSALLVNPGVPVSTASVFAGWDGIDRGPLAEGEVFDAALTGRNDLEAPAIALAPVIGEVIVALGARDARLVRMSGSGATCFALFDDPSAQTRAVRAIADAHPDWWQMESALA